MGYQHIENLYANKEILLFRECYAMEKIHGTSAHVSLNCGSLNFSSGEGSLEHFMKLFPSDLKEKIATYGDKVVIYGEHYGGSIMKMSTTYGLQKKFVAFEVKIGDCWLSVPDAAEISNNLGLEFVDYVRIPTTMEAIDAERNKPSTQAIRNGMGEHKREGIVLRPLIELTKNNGERIVSKHKNDDFRETATPRIVSDEKLQVLADADAIANEWVVPMRMEHVLQKFPGHNISMLGDIIISMIEDVLREGKDEIVVSKEVKTAISKKTASMYKGMLKDSLKK